MFLSQANSVAQVMLVGQAGAEKIKKTNGPKGEKKKGEGKL